MTTTLDNSGRPTRIRAVNGSTVISDLSYSYTAGTTDTELAQTRTDNKAALTTTYVYDSKDELTAAVERNSGGSTVASWLYCYDNAGNRTATSTTAGATCASATTTYTYNAANELTARSGVAGWTYDANGNEVSTAGGAPSQQRSGETYSPTNQLTGGTGAGSTSLTAGYAGLTNDERVSTSGKTYQNGPVGLASQAGTNAATFVHDPTGTLIAERVSGASYYYVYDGIGSIVALVNSIGTAVDTYSYDPYGQTRASTGTQPNPFQYAGYYNDGTGLYHVGARYYDAAIGRFTERDPSGHEANAYAYAVNSPANEVDPSGLAGGVSSNWFGTTIWFDEFSTQRLEAMFAFGSGAAWTAAEVTAWTGVGGLTGGAIAAILAAAAGGLWLCDWNGRGVQIEITRIGVPLCLPR
jgi:RHS repeat-associated protein